MVSSASGHAYGPTVSWSKQPSVLLTVRSHSIPSLATAATRNIHTQPHRHSRIRTAVSAQPHFRSNVQHTRMFYLAAVLPEHRKLEYGGSVEQHDHANLHVMVLGRCLRVVVFCTGMRGWNDPGLATADRQCRVGPLLLSTGPRRLVRC